MNDMSKPTARPRYWCGPVAPTCQLCGKALVEAFVDGYSRSIGQWAFLDPACHERTGLGLGTGQGQRYDRQTDGRWMKTAG